MLLDRGEGPDGYHQRGLDMVEYRAVSCVFQNIDPPPPLHLVSVSSHAGWRGGWGSMFWKTQDIGLASYSNNLSTVILVHFSL